VNAEIRLHDTLALPEDVATRHFLNGEPLVLRRGRAGTVVMTYDGSAFADDVAKTNLTAILQQYSLENVRSL
jgi:hypothetical protein